MEWDTYHEKTLGYNMIYEIYAAMDAYPLVNKNGRREDRKANACLTTIQKG